MRTLSGALSFLIAVGLVCGTVCTHAQDAANSDLAGILSAAQDQLPGNLDPKDVQIYLDGVASYIYGYPLVAIAMTERVSTNVEYSGEQLGRAPINQLYRATALPVGSQFKDVVLPSTTTMYATGFYNLQKEPFILHVPAISSDRFFIVQLLDGWTNVSRQSPGSRLSSANPGDYALVGPQFTGDLPSGLAGVIRFDTNTVWQIMRVLTTGTKEDQDTIYQQIFKPLAPIPLSEYVKHGTDYTPPAVLPVNPSIDVVTQPIKQVDSLDACAFFGTMSAMMMSNPPRKVDAFFVPVLERLGIYSSEAGTPVQFSCANYTDDTRSQERALQLAVLTGRQILSHPPNGALTSTNWSVSLDVGDYGLHYLLRAVVAKNAIGANRPQDAVYGYGIHDSAYSGDPNDPHYLYGSNNYVLHFRAPTATKGAKEIPPVDGNGFWSITMYNIDGTVVDNQVASYHALGTNGTQPREIEGHFSCPNPDGSLDVFVQSVPPTDSKQLCNWLESPKPTGDNAQFILFLRMYWPDKAITSGRWYPPGIDLK
jgi:hypothetical protein